VDQIFDRLGKLVQAWVSSTFNEGAESANYRDAGVFEDQDLANAWDELNSFLDPSKTETQRREEEARHQEKQRRSSTATPQANAERVAVEEAYRFLNLAPYAPFADVKSRYKELLKKHHPDRHTGSPEDLKKATAVSARINAAYQLIEAWEESRTKSRAQ